MANIRGFFLACAASVDDFFWQSSYLIPRILFYFVRTGSIRLRSCSSESHTFLVGAIDAMTATLRLEAFSLAMLEIHLPSPTTKVPHYTTLPAPAESD